MANIIITDLVANKELDKKAMLQISGGFNPQPEPPASFMPGTRGSRLNPRYRARHISRSRLKLGNPIGTKGIIIVES